MQWLEGSGVATAVVEVATMAQIQSLARNFHMLPIRPKRKKKKKKERINIKYVRSQCNSKKRASLGEERREVGRDWLQGFQVQGNLLND